MSWDEVKQVTTRSYGFLNLLKSTEIESKNKVSITLFPLMEEYLHFLKDITSQTKSAQIEKLTSDLIIGRDDVRSYEKTNRSSIDLVT